MVVTRFSVCSASVRKEFKLPVFAFILNSNSENGTTHTDAETSGIAFGKIPEPMVTH